LLQEEAVDSALVAHAPQYTANKANLKNAMPLPPPPPKQDKPLNGPAPTEAAPNSTSALGALKAYRRALGLCNKCITKWSKDHKCALEVLHVVHDLWESLSSSATEDLTDSATVATEQIFLALSKSTVSGAPASRIVQFLGSLEGIPVSILLYSGSSSSFGSHRVA